MDKTYHIKLDGKLIPVSEEVYRAYQQPKWREKKQAKMRTEKERSIEAFLDSNFDIPTEEALLDEIVADKLLLDELCAALAELTDDERNLINALFYENKSERYVAATASISHQTIHKKKNRILAKLRNLLNL